jgi:hypothetical protein
MLGRRALREYFFFSFLMTCSDCRSLNIRVFSIFSLLAVSMPSTVHDPYPSSDRQLYGRTYQMVWFTALLVAEGTVNLRLHLSSSKWTLEVSE